jgi:hypothetical protein
VARKDKLANRTGKYYLTNSKDIGPLAYEEVLLDAERSPSGCTTPKRIREIARGWVPTAMKDYEDHVADLALALMDLDSVLEVTDLGDY